MPFHRQLNWEMKILSQQKSRWSSNDHLIMHTVWFTHIFDLWVATKNESSFSRLKPNASNSQSQHVWFAIKLLFQHFNKLYDIIQTNTNWFFDNFFRFLNLNPYFSSFSLLNKHKTKLWWQEAIAVAFINHLDNLRSK